jgi:hypothetical protein
MRDLLAWIAALRTTTMPSSGFVLVACGVRSSHLSQSARKMGHLIFVWFDEKFLLRSSRCHQMAGVGFYDQPDFVAGVELEGIAGGQG